MSDNYVVLFVAAACEVAGIIIAWMSDDDHAPLLIASRRPGGGGWRLLHEAVWFPLLDSTIYASPQHKLSLSL